MQSFFFFFSLFKIENLAINRIYTHNTPSPISIFFFLMFKQNGEFSPHKKSLIWKEDVETLAMTPMKF